ncbi:MAG: peptidyl-alpha-hydroxyglycine alpha-amidating lyase family protein [Acidobacteria bacterium]|nr:peptidyl-alpha-hydroxyglycine alpha-amidating lyase family protein [Acidobacteriota bacterium]
MMPTLKTALCQKLGLRTTFPIFTAIAATAILAAFVPGMVGAPQGGGQSATPEQVKVKPVNYLPNPYETVPNFGTLPDGRTWGAVSAVNVDADGKHIWAGDRCGTNSCAGSDVDPIVKLDPNGKVVQSFGAGMLIWPHGMDVDRQGNIWVADTRSATPKELETSPDAAGKGHVVIKFSPQGKVLMTLGTPGTAGDLPTHFTEPNDVLVAPDGSIFVGEGHVSQGADNAAPAPVARMSKFSPDGKLTKSWGSWGSGPGQFRSPHSLAMDSLGRLFVADRGNSRIQIFDQDGKLLDTWYQFSRPSGVYIAANDVLYAIDSDSDEVRNPGWRKGLRVGSARTGEVTYFVPEHFTKRAPGQGVYGSMGEGVAVDAQGNVYAGEVAIRGLSKFIPRLIP